MNNKYHDITIALAGVCQSAMLVPKLANTGQCSNSSYDIALGSIFNINPTSTLDVFGNINNIHDGLAFLTQSFSRDKQNSMEAMRYIFGAINISNKLMKNDDSLTKISQRLERIQSLYHDQENIAMIANNRDEISYSLGGIYSDIISPLTTKIRVNGQVEYLQNTLIQAKVRAALFASVRSAILWHQVGGNRLQLLFMRRNITHAANDILQNNR